MNYYTDNLVRDRIIMIVLLLLKCLLCCWRCLGLSMELLGSQQKKGIGGVGQVGVEIGFGFEIEIVVGAVVLTGE